MARPKKEPEAKVELVKTNLSLLPEAVDLNVLRDKLNEIINYLNK